MTYVDETTRYKGEQVNEHLRERQEGKESSVLYQQTEREDGDSFNNMEIKILSIRIKDATDATITGTKHVLED